MERIKKIIRYSPFANQYGGLSLGVGDDGEKYLVMGDCFGPEYFGPLTKEQEQAFNTLCRVKNP